MPNSSDSELFARRRALQNPYAYIDEKLEELDATDAQISRSRVLHGNQYAHLGPDGGYEALQPVSNSVRERDDGSSLDKPGSTAFIQFLPKNDGKPSSYTREQIEGLVQEFLRGIWAHRDAIWSDGVPIDPVDLLDSEVALNLIGFNFLVEETLGQMRSPRGGQPIEVAGAIDYEAKTVRIGRRFRQDVQNFTAAHELGHAVLHRHAGALHRDKPLDGSAQGQERIEREADWFAVLFLMPEKLVRSRFEQTFRTTQFELTEETAFALRYASLSTLREKIRSTRDLSLQLATTGLFDGRHFTPFHQQFGVSAMTMAIRLEELGLVSAID